jgi:hypothetical protein
MATPDDLIRTLRSVIAFETAEKSVAQTRVRLLGRLQLPKNAQGDWLVFLHHIHTLSERFPWNLDSSKLYFKRDGKLVFGWRLIFQTEDESALDNHIDQICNGMKRAPKSARRELTEVPLVGASPNRNAYRKGKGVALAGKARLGPNSITEDP